MFHDTDTGPTPGTYARSCTLLLFRMSCLKIPSLRSCYSSAFIPFSGGIILFERPPDHSALGLEQSSRYLRPTDQMFACLPNPGPRFAASSSGYPFTSSSVSKHTATTLTLAGATPAGLCQPEPPAFGQVDGIGHRHRHRRPVVDGHPSMVGWDLAGALELMISPLKALLG